MISVRAIRTEALMEEAARYLWGKLKEKLDGGRKIFLLLSGGSATEVYKNLTEWIIEQDAVFATNLAVGLVDERYGEMGHLNSNEEKIRKTGFYDLVLRKGGKAITILTGENPQDEASRYELLVRQNLKEAEEVIAVLGVGSDGHTAGILPQEPQEKFEQIFPQNRLVAYYEAPIENPNPFKKRITLTPTALQKINLAIVVVRSQGKEEALRKMLSPGEPVYKTPAVLLQRIKSILFTDQKITQPEVSF